MKTKDLTPDVSALKNSLRDAFTIAYMLDNRVKKQGALIDRLIEQLREAGVKEYELMELKTTAFYIANPLDNFEEN